jgi:drug/metabolite transporter (DMT)-like permease
LILAFAAVYVIWGSTYLTIRFAVMTLPPFLMAGARFLTAGSLLYAWARAHGAERPSRSHWAAAGIVGAFLLLGGNGAVVWAAKRIPSGLSSLVVATTPLWMAGIDWMRRGGVRPSRQVLLGLLLGFAGLVLLIGSKEGTLAGAGDRIDMLPALVLLLGTISWASGSIYARHARLPASSVLATAMEQLSGGALLIGLGIVAQEPWRFDPASVSLRSLLSFLYLLVLGSIVAFTAYIWLLKVTSAAMVSTYAYVNPLVAVFLGWAFGDEALSQRTLLAAGVILLAVAVITTGQIRKPSSDAKSDDG